MIPLSEITLLLNEELRISSIPDYSGAVNGLQLENSGSVTRVAAAVDASFPVIQKAIAMGADLLIVHHGIFWQPLQPLTGPTYRKIKAAMDAGLAIYSAHLPLDVHPVFGNNSLMMKSLGFESSGSFLDWKGLQIGLTASVDISRADLLQRIAASVGSMPHFCPGGPEQIRRIGLVTGGAGSEVAAAAAAGVDTFITGEGPHWSYPLAEELGINLIYAGHYATETFGVKALAGHLHQIHELPWDFIDHPTGL
jgi:dinuclear metal center YbgI/SA1388 family protein